MANFGNIFLAMQDRLERMKQQGELTPEDEENLRLYSAAAQSMHNFANSQEKPEGEVGQPEILAPAPAEPREPTPEPAFDQDILALTKIERATEKKPCTFCEFGCDFGVSDDNVLLPKDVSSGYCEECNEANSQSEFFQVWMSQPRYKQGVGKRGTKDMRFFAADDNATKGGEGSGSGAGETVLSKIDGSDITKYMKPMFCHYWHQLDVTKARICDDCRLEKLLVISHGKRKFLPSISPFLLPNSQTTLSSSTQPIPIHLLSPPILSTH